MPAELGGREIPEDLSPTSSLSSFEIVDDDAPLLGGGNAGGAGGGSGGGGSAAVSADPVWRELHRLRGTIKRLKKMVKSLGTKFYRVQNRDSHETYALEAKPEKRCYIEYVKLSINGQSVDRMEDAMTLDNCRWDEFRLYENLGNFFGKRVL